MIVVCDCFRGYCFSSSVSFCQLFRELQRYFEERPSMFLHLRKYHKANLKEVFTCVAVQDDARGAILFVPVRLPNANRVLQQPIGAEEQVSEVRFTHDLENVAQRCRSFGRIAQKRCSTIFIKLCQLSDLVETETEPETALEPEAEAEPGSRAR
jgi:hypothetical protein